jgi:hypothetical protein
MGGSLVRGFSGKPRGGHESDRIQTDPPEPLESALDAIACLGSAEGQELGLAGSFSPGAPLISWGTRQTHLVVPLPVENDLGTVGGPGPEPLDEAGVYLQRPVAMPVGYYQERWNDATLGADRPEPRNRLALSRTDVVDRDQEHYRSRMR